MAQPKMSQTKLTFDPQKPKSAIQSFSNSNVRLESLIGQIKQTSKIKEEEQQQPESGEKEGSEYFSSSSQENVVDISTAKLVRVTDLYDSQAEEGSENSSGETYDSIAEDYAADYDDECVLQRDPKKGRQNSNANSKNRPKLQNDKVKTIQFASTGSKLFMANNEEREVRFAMHDKRLYFAQSDLDKVLGLTKVNVKSCLKEIVKEKMKMFGMFLDRRCAIISVLDLYKLSKKVDSAYKEPFLDFFGSVIGMKDFDDNDPAMKKISKMAAHHLKKKEKKNSKETKVEAKPPEKNKTHRSAKSKEQNTQSRKRIAAEPVSFFEPAQKKNKTELPPKNQVLARKLLQWADQCIDKADPATLEQLTDFLVNWAE